MSDTEEYLIYSPVSFIAPTHPPPKQKEPRRRKNAIVQLEQPSALEAIRQKAIEEQKQQKQQQHEQLQQQKEEVSLLSLLVLDVCLSVCLSRTF